MTSSRLLHSFLSLWSLSLILLSCSSGNSEDPSTSSLSPSGPPQVRFEVDIPMDISATSYIKMAGTFNEWNPFAEGYALTEIDSLSYFIELDFAEADIGATIQYKYLLLLEGQDDNGWTNVEGSLTGGEIGNRTYVLKAGEQTVNDTVLSFKNNTGKTSITRGSMQPITLDMPQYSDGRRRIIRIWLPDGYEPTDTTTKYPVLYMHDGQNLFDSYTSFSGEWKVDEAIGDFMDDGYSGAIVVGIDNSIDRLNELSPSWPRSSVGNPVITDPSGEKYAAFIVDTVKPYIDSHFNTNPSRETTGIGGSSMGGVMSFFMALTYPETFGYAMLFSSAMQVYTEATTETFVGGFDFEASADWPKLYIYAGGSGGEATITPYVAILHDALLVAGYPEALMTTRTDTSKGHNESAWAIYFPIAYAWLVGI